MTTDQVIQDLKEWVRKSEIHGPQDWIDSAFSLVVLLGDENDKLFRLQQDVAANKTLLIAQGATVASAKTSTEATDTHRVMMSQKAKIEQIVELIRIAKIQARLRDSESKSY